MYKTSIHIGTLINALNIIADSEHGDNYRVTLNPLSKIEDGKIIKKNDEFVIKSAEIMNGGTKVNLSVNPIIKAFIEQIAIGKILLLKGKKNGPFIKIEIINDQLAIIEL